MIYIIVFAGHEGIEEILWGGTDKEEAAAKIKEYKNIVVQLSKEMDEDIGTVEKGDYDTEMERWDAEWEWLEKKKLEDLPFEIDSTRNFSPSRYCIMAYKEGDKSFHCVCSEMGVGLDKPWFY